MSNAIKIKLTKTENSEDNLSHFFGSPVIPASLEDAVYDLDEDVMFFGQLELSQIAELDTEGKLPHNGYLYLFLDTASYPYEAIVLYSADEPECIVEDFNSEVVEFEKFTVPYAVSFEATDGDCTGTKLFGEPSWDFDDGEELFMQFDPLDNETGFLTQIDGYAFFTFGDKKRTPEKINFTIDRS